MSSNDAGRLLLKFLWRRASSSSRWFCLIPIGFPIPVLRRGFRLGRKESGTIRHLDFQQSLGVEGVTFFYDVALVEQKSSHSVDLVKSERSLCVPRHGAIDIVPHRRRERPIAPGSQYWSMGGERVDASYQTRGGAFCPGLPMTK